MAEVFLPDGDLDTATNQAFLRDIWWRVASKSGAGLTFLRQGIRKFGEDGKAIGWTTVEIEIGWLAYNFARLQATVEQLAVKQGVNIDYQALAKAVVDEQAKRLND